MTPDEFNGEHPQVMAKGIHALGDKKLGLAPPKNAPAITASSILTGSKPTLPSIVDHLGSLPFGLYGNDKYGDCGPTGVANLVRLVSAWITGTEVQPSQDDVFSLYAASTTPPFDPTTGANDNGVVLQTMLEALMRVGIGDGNGGVIKPVAFAKVNVDDDEELELATAAAGGLLWGVNLLTAQQAQSNGTDPIWKYLKSPEWGGHCVMNGDFERLKRILEIISWALKVKVELSFREKQLQEAWMVIWPWNISSEAASKGVNLSALETAYKDVTGKTLVVPS